MHHLSDPPPPLRSKVPSISSDVEQVVMTTLAKDPEHRFASIRAFATALEQASLGRDSLVPSSGGGGGAVGRGPLRSPVVGTPHVPLSSITSSGAMFGYDLAHTHFNPHEHILSPTNVSRLVHLWSATTGDVIFSSPAVANGVVYVGSNDKKLYAFHVP